MKLNKRKYKKRVNNNTCKTPNNISRRTQYSSNFHINIPKGKTSPKLQTSPVNLGFDNLNQSPKIIINSD